MKPQYKRGLPEAEAVIRVISRFYKLKMVWIMANEWDFEEISIREAAEFLAASRIIEYSVSKACRSRAYIKAQAPVVIYPDIHEVTTQPICLRLDFAADKDMLDFLQVLGIVRDCSPIKTEWSAL